tara:strand:- start:3205 stop:4257 length:1053 start_codon:yes stop_codon:yes gene_type:complete
MNYSLKSIDEYQKSFFEQMVFLSNQLNKGHPLFVPKNIERDFLEFKSGHSFDLNNHWRAFLLLDEVDAPVACAIVTRCKASAEKKSFLGFFESVKDCDLTLLFKSCEDYARTLDSTELIGPIQGSIFNSYKFKLDQKIFMGGDPVHPSYYPELWKDAGYSLVGRWENILVSRLVYLLKIFVSFLFSYRGKNLTARPYNPYKREEEIKLLYDLVIDSYSNMMAFTPISLEEFKHWNEIILDSNFERSFIFIQHKEEPIGFNIDLVLPFLKDGEEPSMRMQFAYVGKKRHLAEKARGVADIVMRYHILHRVLKPFGPIPLVTGVYENSPFRHWLLKSGYSVVGTYGLYGKKL